MFSRILIELYVGIGCRQCLDELVEEQRNTILKFFVGGSRRRAVGDSSPGSFQNLGTVLRDEITQHCASVFVKGRPMRSAFLRRKSKEKARTHGEARTPRATDTICCLVWRTTDLTLIKRSSNQATRKTRRVRRRGIG